MNKNKQPSEPAPSAPSGKAAYAESSMKSHAGGRSAGPHPKRGVPPKGGTPPYHTGQTGAVDGKAQGPSLGLGLAPSSPGKRNPQGRYLDRAARVKALRRAVLKAEVRLERSMAHRPEPWPRDLERWDAMRAHIALLQKTLADVLAGGDPPGSPRTGSRTKELPDAYA